MPNRDTLILAKNRLVMLRGDLAAIEADVVSYRNVVPNAIDAPVTAGLQNEAWAWKLVIERASSALSYWIADIQTEIDELQP
ncbi:MAG: hypothetical protein JJE47_11490 [Acidimicrobiia bacterium]|nr:hypothetical protein [Acidimicrobiia bacterium]